MTVVEWLMPYEPTGEVQVVRGVLGRMLFSGDDALKPTDGLSGGETARPAEAVEARDFVRRERREHLRLARGESR